MLKIFNQKFFKVFFKGFLNFERVKNEKERKINLRECVLKICTKILKIQFKKNIFQAQNFNMNFFIIFLSSQFLNVSFMF